YAEAVETFEACGGYQMEARIDAALSALEMKEVSLDQQVTNLSGGQKTKLTLARVMLVEAEILLLDEPTNNLDCNTLEWLEEALTQHRGCALIISHDRRLLNR